MFGSGITTLIISNEEMNGIMKVVKFLESWRIWFIDKGVTETIKNEAKEQKGGMLLGTLGAILLGNLQTGKGTIMASASREKIRARHDF